MRRKMTCWGATGLVAIVALLAAALEVHASESGTAPAISTP
jgi:hypothetical protein